VEVSSLGAPLIDPRGRQDRLLKVYVRPELAEELEQRARLDGRSVSSFIRQLVESIVDTDEMAGAA
jgi:Ribbon-helix-helix protein, copG family